jgi:hypothetical protein
LEEESIKPSSLLRGKFHNYYFACAARNEEDRAGISIITFNTQGN